MSRISDGTKGSVTLLSEKDYADHELTRRALYSVRLETEPNMVDVDEEALDHLQRRGRYTEPELLSRPNLCIRPIVALSSTKWNRDLLSRFELGSDFWIQQPGEIEQFIEVASRLEKYWIKMVTSPTSTCI